MELDAVHQMRAAALVVIQTERKQLILLRLDHDLAAGLEDLVDDLAGQLGNLLHGKHKIAKAVHGECRHHNTSSCTIARMAA